MTEISDMPSRRDYNLWKLRNNWEEIRALEVKVAELLAHRDKLQRDSDLRGEVQECSRCHAVEAIAWGCGDVATFSRFKSASVSGGEALCSGCLDAVAGVPG